MHSFEQRQSIQLENEGLKIFGVLHLPDPLPPHPVPAVLICHGLAGNKCGKDRIYVRLATELTKRGIAALRIDFRGCGDSEGELAQMSMESHVSDATQALHYLSTHPAIDPNKLALFGRSFGGAISILVAQRFKNIRSIILWAPVFDGSQWLESWQRLQAQHFSKSEIQQLMSFNGQIVGPLVFEQLFALKLKDSFEALKEIPLLHIHGEKDEVVLIHHAEKYEFARHHALAKTKFIRLPKSDHSFSVAVEKNQALQLSLEWFEETLLQATKTTAV